jgi:hypothetical protein
LKKSLPVLPILPEYPLNSPIEETNENLGKTGKTGKNDQNIDNITEFRRYVELEMQSWEKEFEMSINSTNIGKFLNDYIERRKQLTFGGIIFVPSQIKQVIFQLRKIPEPD